MTMAERLEELGWPAAAIVGILHHGVPVHPKGSERQQRYADWCSAHEKDPVARLSPIEFVDYELNNTLAGIGRLLRNANVADEAIELFGEYARRFYG